MHTHNTENDNMQHIQENTEQRTEQRTETNTLAENTCTTSTQNSAHNYRTYSIDLYHEYAYIKNSNTIELYTILK